MDVSSWFEGCTDLAGRTPSELARGLEGSRILKIAAEVRELQERGRPIANLTVGDFATGVFDVPPDLVALIQEELAAGQTNYPPAVGIPELRAAIRSFYADRLGLSFPDGSVQIGSGARPPIYAAFRTLVGRGDTVVYQIPSWNVSYYVYLTEAEGIPLVTGPEADFLLTVDDVLPHLPRANLLVLNSPLNPTGTVFPAEQLRQICEAVVQENRRRSAIGGRPLMVLYDQVYWQLIFGEDAHVTPLHVVPEMARYTVLVDAISKSWAATGVRVGWAVMPPWVRDRMAPLVGHMGAWAGRAEQRATARLLAEPQRLDGWMRTFNHQVQVRLQRLADGLQAMRALGLPVDVLQPEGAIYLTARFELHGRRYGGAVIADDDDMRRCLLEGAGVAVVPFTAFGYPEGSGWVRLSIGAVDLDDIDRALERLRALLVRMSS